MWLEILETSGSGEDVLRICNVIGETYEMKNGINSYNFSSNYTNV